MKGNNQLYDIVHIQIACAAKPVFMKYGYTKVSMDDIAKACNKSRTTLYHYFKNKKEVFNLIALLEFNQIFDFASEAVNEYNSLQKNITIFNQRKISKVKNLIHAHEDFLEELKGYSDIFSNLFEYTMDKETALFEKMLQWAIEADEIEKISVVDIKILATIIVTASRGFEEEIIKKNEIDAIESRIDWMVKILCKGLQA